MFFAARVEFLDSFSLESVDEKIELLLVAAENYGGAVEKIVECYGEDNIVGFHLSVVSEDSVLGMGNENEELFNSFLKKVSF